MFILVYDLSCCSKYRINARALLTVSQTLAHRRWASFIVALVPSRLYVTTSTGIGHNAVPWARQMGNFAQPEGQWSVIDIEGDRDSEKRG